MGPPYCTKCRLLCLQAFPQHPEQTYLVPEKYFSWHITLRCFSLSSSLFETLSGLKVVYVTPVGDKCSGMLITYTAGIINHPLLWNSKLFLYLRWLVFTKLRALSSMPQKQTKQNKTKTYALAIKSKCLVKDGGIYLNSQNSGSWGRRIVCLWGQPALCRENLSQHIYASKIYMSDFIYN